MNEIDAWTIWATTTTATHALFGWLSGSNANMDDDDVAECAEFVLDTLSNADTVRTVECITEKNLREQMSVQQAIDLEAEGRTRSWWGRN